MFIRYALYFTPASGTPLAEFGANWLGWDSATGTPRAHPDMPGLDVATITATPRKYGFHGTLKPPFRLAEGCTADALASAMDDFCAKTPSVRLAGLELSKLGRFLALTPQGDTTKLAALAAGVVEVFDPFRAPLNDAELAKRRAGGLTPAQEAHLQAWGYPFVMDQFRFHLTLSGRLAPELADDVVAALAPKVAALPIAPYDIDGLTLLGEDADGRFHQVHRIVLSG